MEHIPLVQMRAREVAAAEMAANAAKPFARTADDVDQDMSLRDRVRCDLPFIFLTLLELARSAAGALLAAGLLPSPCSFAVASCQH